MSKDNENKKPEVEDKRQKGIEEGMVKKVVTITMVGAVVIAILITFVFNKGGPSKVDEDAIDEPPKEEQQIEDDRNKILEGIDGEQVEGVAEVEDSVEARAAKSVQQAKDNLERADEPVSEDLTEEQMAVLTEDLQGLFSHLGQDFSDFDGDYFTSTTFADSIARQTEPYMARQIHMAQTLIGYRMAPETAQWFYSDTEEVYQFTINLKVEGRDDLVFSGNYNKDERFFKVFKMHGELDVDDFAS